jgi:hypothetical protein
VLANFDPDADVKSGGLDADVTAGDADGGRVNLGDDNKEG